ncbi:hypothetical protein LEP1GSC116_1170 [Leptospira interrogans serovar Icterohaemorrhagiae str. Verdun HP]|uniref:Uncharacterized protein n=1 Tax=Leptospira interrogans serovar Icterohaemorrhagiae str. Verdun HP TaxID=1049910 RepID=M6RBK7_LEPIR|nr:hypothetical protein LEP1GSC116_1170 [Leptospira interrogans serovar Icterohaemorrhagiae str. Verdun HP]
MNADPFFPFKKNEIDRIQIGRKGHETVLKKTRGSGLYKFGKSKQDPI